MAGPPAYADSPGDREPLPAVASDAPGRVSREAISLIREIRDLEAYAWVASSLSRRLFPLDPEAGIRGMESAWDATLSVVEKTEEVKALARKLRLSRAERTQQAGASATQHRKQAAEAVLKVIGDIDSGYALARKVALDFASIDPEAGRRHFLLVSSLWDVRPDRGAARQVAGSATDQPAASADPEERCAAVGRVPEDSRRKWMELGALSADWFRVDAQAAIRVVESIPDPVARSLALSTLANIAARPGVTSKDANSAGGSCGRQAFSAATSGSRTIPRVLEDGGPGEGTSCKKFLPPEITFSIELVHSALEAAALIDAPESRIRCTVLAAKAMAATDRAAANDLFLRAVRLVQELSDPWEKARLTAQLVLEWSGLDRQAARKLISSIPDRFPDAKAEAHLHMAAASDCRGRKDVETAYRLATSGWAPQLVTVSETTGTRSGEGAGDSVERAPEPPKTAGARPTFGLSAAQVFATDGRGGAYSSGGARERLDSYARDALVARCAKLMARCDADRAELFASGIESQGVRARVMAHVMVARGCSGGAFRVFDAMRVHDPFRSPGVSAWAYAGIAECVRESNPSLAVKCCRLGLKAAEKSRDKSSRVDLVGTLSLLDPAAAEEVVRNLPEDRQKVFILVEMAQRRAPFDGEMARALFLRSLSTLETITAGPRLPRHQAFAKITLLRADSDPDHAADICRRGLAEATERSSHGVTGRSCVLAPK
ncbi:MAG: hypothetical protein AB1646_23065 [Thermodesulfobacteriota bacterium]